MVVVNGVTEEVNAVQDDDTKVLFTWKFSDSYIYVVVGAVNAVTVVLLVVVPETKQNEIFVSLHGHMT